MATAVVDRLNLERIRQVLRKSPFSAHSKSHRNFRKRILPIIADLKYSIALFKYEAKRVDWTYLTNGASTSTDEQPIATSWEFKNKTETLVARVDQILLDLGNLISMTEGDRRLNFENMLDQIRSFKNYMVRAFENRDINMLRKLGDFEGVDGETEALVFNCMLSALDEYIS